MTKSKEPNYQQSETVTIKRSMISFAPYNPKNHSREQIVEQRRNIKRVGILGGIVFNETTGNLVSGHKRTMALDDLNKYDGTPETDYDIKVERVQMDSKTEKEQNLYMDAKSTNTMQDLDLVALMLPDIDYKNAGLSDLDMCLLGVDIKKMTSNAGDLYEDEQEQKEPTPEEKEAKKQKIIDSKKTIQNDLNNKFEAGDPILTLSFDSFANKSAFMQRFGFDIYDKFIKGEIFENMIERIE